MGKRISYLANFDKGGVQAPFFKYTGDGYSLKTAHFKLRQI
jgi:hypothetical protein